MNGGKGQDISPETSPAARLLGRPMRRIEDRALLMGRGRYVDDFPVSRHTLQAHVVRSPHAHAVIRGIDAAAARARKGVHAVITGEDVKKLSDPFLVALKAPIPQWALAVERVRYVGEPVALVVADNRYLAEDAAELVEVVYEPLPAVVDPRAAAAAGATLIHPEAGTNEVSTRHFAYGDPDGAFARAEARVSLTVEYPRNSFTPMECFVVVAEHSPADGSYDVLANFQGPFSIHPVMARALRVVGPKLRLRTPPASGGSFGIKLSVFPYIVLMSLASRIVGRPVKWVEDRLEHLQAASSGPNRVSTVEAAVTREGRVLAFRFDNLEDYGAFLRAPMPGPLYRMHGAMTGAYDVAESRGDEPGRAHQQDAGEPHPRLRRAAALSRARAADAAHRGRAQARSARGDPAQSRSRRRLSLSRRGGRPLRFRRLPARHSGGGGRGTACRTRAAARRGAGPRPRLWHRLRRRGRAGHVQHGLSLDAADARGARARRPQERRRLARDRRGRSAGRGQRQADAPVQGQGHATVLAQIVAETLGLGLDDVAVNLEIDTAKDAWSIAAGTYSCRFSPGTAVAAHLAARQVRDKLAGVAANQLNVLRDDIEFADGKIRSRSNPDNALSFARVAGTAHWSPVLLPADVAPALRETAVWSPPELEPPASDDRINTSLTYGFVFDICGVEIDPVTCAVRVDRYISMHDAGRILNPLIAEGQVRGAFVQGLAAALYEEFVYDESGAFLSGTFADYLVPTASEVPALEILHIHSPSPFTPLGAKGLAEGNCMSVPACIANAIADALGLKDVPLPATPRRLHALIAGPEPHR